MAKNNNWAYSISQRLGAAFGLVIALLLSVAGTGALSLIESGRSLEKIVQINMVRSQIAGDLLIAVGTMATTVRNIALITDPADLETSSTLLKDTIVGYDRIQEKLKGSLDAFGGDASEFMLLSEIVANSQAAIPEISKAAKQGRDGDSISAVNSITTTVQPLEQAWRAKVESFAELQSQKSAAVSEASAKSQRFVLLTQFTLVIASLALCLATAWRITLSISAPIRQAVFVAEKIAKGDLTSAVEVGKPDEIGRLVGAIATMQENLKVLVGEIGSTAVNIKTSSSDVAIAIAELSSRTEATSDSLKSASSALSALNSSVTETASSASQTTSLAIAVSTMADQSGVSMGQIVQMMDALKSSTKKMSEIIGIIDGIAFQTNILALNAAVEAARAGAQGRGFAVVASEVRGLAGRAAASAKDIKELILQSNERIRVGGDLVASAGKNIEKLILSVSDVSELVREISAANSRQSESVAQIDNSIAWLGDGVQKNILMVKEGASSAQRLEMEAITLNEIVNIFRVSERPVGGQESTNAVLIYDSSVPQSGNFLPRSRM